MSLENQKICHFTSVHDRYDVRIFYKMCIGLVKYSKSVNLIVADGLGDEIKDDVNIVDVGRFSSRSKRILKSPKDIIKKAIELNCDVYHFHDPELIPVGLKLKRKGFNVIFDSHEYLPGQIMDKVYIPTFLRKVISLLIENYFKRKLKKLNAVISVTPHLIKRYEEFGANSHLITNFPITSENEFKSNVESYRSRRREILYAGTIYETSQQEQIIESLSYINDIEYKLIGNIEDDYLNKIKKLKQWSKVKLMSYMPKSDLDKIAMNVRIGLAIFDYIPNLGGKIGSMGVNKIFEYMYYGLPIICTDFILWKEIVDKYKCGICVDPNNPNEIAEAVNYLLDNEQVAYEMGQSGRKAVLTEYNWTTQEQKLLEIYNLI